MEQFDDKLKKAIEVYVNKNNPSKYEIDSFILGWNSRNDMEINEAKELRKKQMSDPQYLADEADEMHDFLSKQNVPEFGENYRILPLLERVHVFYYSDAGQKFIHNQ